MVEDTEAVGVIVTLLKDKTTINHRKLLLHRSERDEPQLVFSISCTEENTCWDVIELTCVYGALSDASSSFMS